MKLGFALSHWGRDTRLDLSSQLFPLETVGRLQEAEDYGLDSAWVPESYHADAFTFMTWIAAHTKTLKVAAGVIPIQSRTPVACAYAAKTLDHLSEGRAIVGLGVTSVNVSEGWYGVPFTRPMARTREYVQIMRDVLAEERPNHPDYEFYPLPAPDGVGGLGRAIRSPLVSYRKDLPILIGAMGPKNIALAAEIADGWMSAYFVPELSGQYEQQLAEGFARPGARRRPGDFMVTALVSAVMDEDVEKAADAVRGQLAFAIAEMGAEDRNFQYDLFVRAGFAAEADRVRQLVKAGQKAAAAASIPLAMVDAVALVGPKARIQDQVKRWRNTAVTTLIIRGRFEALRAIAETNIFG